MLLIRSTIGKLCLLLMCLESYSLFAQSKSDALNDTIIFSSKLNPSGYVVKSINHCNMNLNVFVIDTINHDSSSQYNFKLVDGIRQLEEVKRFKNGNLYKTIHKEQIEGFFKHDTCDFAPQLLGGYDLILQLFSKHLIHDSNILKSSESIYLDLLISKEGVLLDIRMNAQWFNRKLLEELWKTEGKWMPGLSEFKPSDCWLRIPVIVCIDDDGW